MISETHASSTSPMVYTCGVAQPATFHCMKGYRQLGYDNIPASFDSTAQSSYPSIKEEPLDYTACKNPYEQGIHVKCYYP